MTTRKVSVRLIALLLVMLMMSMMVMSVFADSSKTVNVNMSNSSPSVTVTTGNGFWYWWGSQKTVVTVKNTGRYDVNWRIDGIPSTVLRSGETRTVTFGGWNQSGKEHSIKFLRIFGDTTIQVSTNAGSVW